MKRLHVNKLSKRIIFSIALTLIAISIYLSRSFTDDLYKLTDEYYADMSDTIEESIQDEIRHAVKNMNDAAGNIEVYLETFESLEDVNILSIQPIIKQNLELNPHFKGIVFFASHEDHLISHYWYRVFDNKVSEWYRTLDGLAGIWHRLKDGESYRRETKNLKYFNEFFNYKKYALDDSNEYGDYQGIMGLTKNFTLTADYHPVMGKEILLTTYGVPISYQDEHIGFVGFDLTSKFFDHLTTHIDRYPIKDYMIYSDKYVVAGSDPATVGVEIAGETFSGIPWMDDHHTVTFQFTDDVEWHFAYDFNDDTLVKTIDKTALNIYISGLFAFVIIILLNSLTINRALGPIMAINTVIKNATKGNLSSRVDVHSKDEVGSIGENLNILLETLESSQEELGNKIAINESLNEDLKTLMHSAEETYFDTIKSLVNTIEAKDGYTAGHCDRVTNIAIAIAKEAGHDAEGLKTIMFGSSLHDIGKIAISGQIINKPTYLTDEEFSIIRSHSVKGYDIVKDVHFLGKAKDIVLQHHERYDGKGYPYGLKGQEIDPNARIVAIADTYDAMTSSRSYRGALSKEVARAEILANSGTQFDPEYVACFMRVLDSKSDI